VSESEPRYPYVAVDVAGEESDEASAELFELGAQGVEERDQTTLAKGAAAGKVTLVASFASHDEARAAVAELRPEWSPRLEEVVGDAWRDEWKKHFHPFEICEGVVIRPPWEPYVPPVSVPRPSGSGPVVLELEPGRAFGTGLHETTSLCAEALRAMDVRGRAVLDVGCGSGILSLVALALGASPARAVDVDPDAVAVTRENAARNGMQDRLHADTTDVAALDGVYPVILANIEARVLIPMAEALAARVAPGGRLVLSGVLATQHDDVARAYAARALSLLETRARGEWVALVLERAAP
jgi:ribosomal protein L11 methyltransferase